MAGAKSFRELKVYQAAREGAKRVFFITQSFPREERYSLTDQIRRSSRAVKAMVAEAWARRRYKAAFINKIDEALGEANETQSWLDDAFDCRYLLAADFEELDNRYQAIGGMLSRMIDRADSFCKHAPSTDYRTINRVEEEFYSPITDHYSHADLANVSKTHRVPKSKARRRTARHLFTDH
jgi:four helix bundle protein